MDDSHLKVCVIDVDRCVLYEWNGSRTVNIYSLGGYADSIRYNWPLKNIYDDKGMDIFTMSADNPNAQDFVNHVIEHLEPDDE